MLSYDVEKGRTPFVYGISYDDKNGPVLKLTVDNELVEHYKDVKPNEVYLATFSKKMDLGEFIPFGGDQFGFSKGPLKKVLSKNQTTEYEIKIPPIRLILDSPCKECQGSGWSTVFDRECSYCHGSKRNSVYDWKPAKAVSASLQFLTSMAEIYKGQKELIEDPQLLTFQVNCGDNSLNGFPLYGAYGADFCNWLVRSIGANDYHCFDTVIKRMKEVYEYMFPGLVYGYDFQAYTKENAWLIINCPGNATGIHPEDSYNWEPGIKGKRFGCHNMDTPAQQIVLLVALAMLSDMARKEIKGF